MTRPPNRAETKDNDVTLGEMLAEIRDWTATPPTRCPPTLRVGPGVLAELKRLAEPAAQRLALSLHTTWPSVTRSRWPCSLTATASPVVSIVEDASYPIVVWRIFDQWDEEISEGVIPVPGATVKLVLDDGGSKNMRVLTVSRDDRGRITEYTAADAGLFDEMPYATKWLR